MQNAHRADFWEMPYNYERKNSTEIEEYFKHLETKEAGRGLLAGKFLKSQPTTNATTQYAYRADFWEIPYEYERKNTTEMEEYVNHLKESKTRLASR